MIICRMMTLGTSALHMAASPTEDNTVRTKTTTPDWCSWEIVRPFPRSHICKSKEKKMSAIRVLVTHSAFLRKELHLETGNFSQHDSREKYFPLIRDLRLPRNPQYGTCHPLIPMTVKGINPQTLYKTFRLNKTKPDQGFPKCVSPKTSSSEC